MTIFFHVTMPILQIFTLTIILQCFFNAMPMNSDRNAEAGPSHESKTIPLKMRIYWHNLKDLRYLNHLSTVATPENETIGDGRFQISLFPIISKNADKPYGEPIVAMTGHYDVGTLNVPEKVLNVHKNDNDKQKEDNGYQGFMVEIRMHLYTATDDDKWKNSQVISKEIKFQINVEEILKCDFVDGGQCFAEKYKMEKADRPVKYIKFIYENKVKNDKIVKIECAVVKEIKKIYKDNGKKLFKDNGFDSNVCLEDKYILHFRNGTKIRINCDESIYPRQNIYTIKRHIGIDGFICKLDLNLIKKHIGLEGFLSILDGNKQILKEADILKDVALKESEIMTKLWELYHKSRNLHNELDKLYQLKSQKADKTKIQIELNLIGIRMELVKAQSDVLLDRCVIWQNETKSASAVQAIPPMYRDAINTNRISIEPNAEITTRSRRKDVNKVVAANESEIMTKLWELYHKSRNLHNELDKLYQLKSQKADKTKIQMELNLIGIRMELVKSLSDVLLDRCAIWQNETKSASVGQAFSPMNLDAKDKNEREKSPAKSVTNKSTKNLINKLGFHSTYAGTSLRLNSNYEAPIVEEPLTTESIPQKAPNSSSSMAGPSKSTHSHPNILIPTQSHSSMLRPSPSSSSVPHLSGRYEPYLAAPIPKDRSPAKSSSLEEGEIPNDESEAMQSATNEEHETIQKSKGEAAAPISILSPSAASPPKGRSPAKSSSLEEGEIPNYQEEKMQSTDREDETIKGKSEAIQIPTKKLNQIDLNSTPPDDPEYPSVPDVTHSLTWTQPYTPYLDKLLANANSPAPLLLEPGQGSDKRKWAEGEDDNAIIQSDSDMEHDEVNNDAGASGNKQLAKKQKKDFDLNL